MVEERLGPLGLPSLLEQLGCEGGRASGCTMPTPTSLMAAGGACIAAYALWEQVKFRLYKASKSGTLSGASMSHHHSVLAACCATWPTRMLWHCGLGQA